MLGEFLETFSPAKQSLAPPGGVSDDTIIDAIRFAVGILSVGIWNGVLGALGGLATSGLSKDITSNIIQGALRLTGSFFESSDK